MSEIRFLNSYETSLLLPIAREFFSEGDIQGKLNESHFIKTTSSQIESGRMFVFVGGAPVRGAISGVMFEDLATGETCCAEFFWFVGHEERGSLGLRLLSEFESECIRRGAVRILMMHHVNQRTEKFKSIYERRGYVLREQVFVRSL